MKEEELDSKTYVVVSLKFITSFSFSLLLANIHTQFLHSPFWLLRLWFFSLLLLEFLYIVVLDQLTNSAKKMDRGLLPQPTNKGVVIRKGVVGL